MKRILFINSGLFSDDSVSTQIAQSLVKRLVEKNPGSCTAVALLEAVPKGPPVAGSHVRQRIHC